MAKYYINVGEQRTILNASTPEQAAVLGFQQIIQRSGKEEFEIQPEVRVSQRGWEERQDDFIIETCIVLALLYFMREDDGE